MGRPRGGASGYDRAAMHGLPGDGVRPGSRGGIEGRDRVAAPRILIVRLSALGDVVHVLPALAALRAAWPRAHVGWLVEDRAASLLEGHPHVDRVHVVPRALWRRRLARDPLEVARGVRRLVVELRRARYDATLDFQSNLRSALLARASGAPVRVGQPRRYAKEGARLLVTDAPAPVPAEAHKVVRNLALLGPLGLAPAAPPRPVVPEPPAARALGEAFARGGPRRAVLHPGVSAFGALKAWREERFAALARGLVAAGARACFAWGGAAEERVARRLAALAPGSEVLPATAGLLDLAALLRRADLVVGVDSGPLHLAAAVGAPVLGLYGPKDPRTYGPFWAPHEVVRAGLECSPCRHRRCPRPDVVVAEGTNGPARLSPCMEALEVDVALAAALRLLDAPRPGRSALA